MPETWTGRDDRILVDQKTILFEILLRMHRTVTHDRTVQYKESIYCNFYIRPAKNAFEWCGVRSLQDWWQ